MKILKKVPTILLLVLLLAGCAGKPVRDATKIDMGAPGGKVERHHLIKVSALANGKMPTKDPKFMLDQGYEEEGLKESEELGARWFRPDPRPEQALPYCTESCGRVLIGQE